MQEQVLNKSDVESIIGNSGDSILQKVDVKARIPKFIGFFIMLLLFAGSTFSQTTLVNPSGDGGFENGTTFAANGWTDIGSVQSWFIGNATPASAGANCAYTSTTAGSWTPGTAASVGHIYRDITIPPGESILNISLKYKILATDPAWDYIRVHVVPTTTIPVAGTLLTVGQLGQTDGTTAYATYNYATSVSPGTVQRLIITFRQDGVSPYGAGALDEILVTSAAPVNYTSTAGGGLWSSPATWVGGTVPTTCNNVTIPSGSIVTVDQTINLTDLNLDGILQWNGTTPSTTVNVLNVSGNFTIGSTGRLHPYNTARVGASINVTGSFTNNGYANLSLIGGLTFNGTNCTLGGTGFFEGDGTVGQVRAITFTGNGSYSVSTTQNLVVHTTMSQTGSGTLNTNGKLSINNTVLLFGRPLNTQVANVAVTAMGTGYTTAPIVSCAGATLWTASAALAIGNIRTTATDIYLCTAAGTSGTTAPTHASGTATDGTATMLWVAPAGTIGTSFITTAPLIGTQYFYGGNLYTAVAATANTTPPTHTSGTVGSYLYAGSAARLSANWDGVSGTVRSLNIVSAGSGYSAAPTISIVANNAGSGATATAVVIQSQASAAYFPVQKSSDAVITGGLTINSDQGTSVSSTNPQASSGVGSVFCTAGGVNYTAAPTLGFSGPTALNLVTNGGSGFTTAPTITITGGTQPVGQAAYTTADFLITVNQGKVVSVYLTNTTKAYITPPTLAFTGGGGTGATLAFPANCWPAATASIGANGQITNCTVTNSGFGYVAPPTVAVGTTSGGIGAGTYTTVASGFTSRIAAYYLINNFFTPSAAASTYLDDAYIPANRKMHALFLNGNANGAKLTGNLTLISGGTGTTANINTSPSPMVLTASGSTTTTSGQNGNVLDLGGNNLVFTWNGYAGATSTFGATKAYLKNGSMTLTGRGGGLTGSTFNFPFLGAATTGGVTVFTGSGTSVANGADISTVKVTETAAPTNVTTTGTGQATGSRAYKVETTTVGAVAGTAGTNPTFKMPLATSVDNIPAAFTQPDIFVSEGTSLSGAWTIRSAAYGLTGALPANGSLTTPTTAPGPVTLASGSHYAWSTVRPTVTNVNNTTLCANSGAFTITGTNFTGITSVSIGTVAVSSYTVVNSTTIDAFAGAPTSGVVTVTNAAGGAGIGTQTITVNPSPAAPTATPASQTVLLGDVASFSATSAGGTLNWYNQPNGGTILFTGSNYTVTPCSTSTYYVAENNGTCEGGRTPLTVNVTTPSITASTATFCGTGGTTTLTANNLSTNVTTSWSSLTPSATLSTTTGNTTVATLTTTSDFQLSTTVTGCPVNNTFLSVGVYPLPNANLTATPDAICPGGSSLINTGLSSGNFSVISIPSQTFAPPANAGILMNLGVAVTPLSGGNLDDGGWGNIPIGFNFNFFGSSFNTLAAGTNGLLMFGPVPGYGTLAGQLGQYNFVGPPYFPNAANPGNIIALIATDLNMGTSVNGSIKYWTEGYAPNRKFVIQYYRVHGFSSNPEATVTCVLYESLCNV
ncbi:MAG: beta strand repeat-containing protein [Bacteroidota bacterium]